MLGKALPRLKAALLAAVMLGGGGGMPALDVALYHGTRGTDLFQTHFESSGKPHSHGDVCVLSSILPSSPQVPSPGLGIVLGSLSFGQAAFPVPTERSAISGILPQSRAPPSPLA